MTSLTEALPGALTAAVGWTVLLTAIRFYAGNAPQYALYGVLSGIIIILTSFYLGAIILMIGAIVNTVSADTNDISPKSTGAKLILKQRTETQASSVPTFQYPNTLPPSDCTRQDLAGFQLAE